MGKEVKAEDGGAYYHLCGRTAGPIGDIDGVVVSASMFTGGVSYIYPTRNSAVGAAWDGTGFFLNGTVDEVRVKTAPRSASWIKLCFENQRPDGQTLVEFQ